MATKIKEAAVVTSTFSVNGLEKSRWKNVGALFQKEDGSMFLRLDAFFNFSALPRNDASDSVIIGLFDPKKRDERLNSNDSFTGFGSGNNDSAIPF